MGYRLSKISTRTGDDGSTGLGDGSRVAKDSLIIEAIGTIDELNSLVGVLAAYDLPDSVAPFLIEIQHHLFDMGGGLVMPDQPHIITASHVDFLDMALEKINQSLPPLEEFILPGGDMATAVCHVARSVCRRAERRVTTLAHSNEIDNRYIQYLNRLSDLLFVMAREISRQSGATERLWRGLSKPD